MQEFVEVTVINWKKYNPRKDVKKHTWFRFENDFWDNPDYAHLSSDDISVLIIVLSNCSRRQRETVRIYFRQIYANRGLTKECVIASLRKLKTDSIIDFVERDQNADVTQTSQHVRTNERTNVEEQPHAEIQEEARAEELITQEVVEPEVLAQPPPAVSVDVTQQQRKHVSNAKVQEVYMSSKYQEFLQLLSSENYRLTPAQKRAMPRSFAEWGEDLDAVSEFISSKFRYAKTQGKTESECCRYAINAFIGEAVQ